MAEAGTGFTCCVCLGGRRAHGQKQTDGSRPKPVVHESELSYRKRPSVQHGLPLFHTRPAISGKRNLLPAPALRTDDFSLLFVFGKMASVPIAGNQLVLIPLGRPRYSQGRNPTRVMPHQKVINGASNDLYMADSRSVIQAVERMNFGFKAMML
jgi:hypothetical protein